MIRNPFTGGQVIGSNVTPEKYRANEGKRGTKEFVMSRSSLADFIECPSKWRDGHESKDTDATTWGTLMDTLVLAPKQFHERYAVYPETYPFSTTENKPWNNNAKYCRDWKATQPGKTFIWAEKIGSDGSPDEEKISLANAYRAKERLLAQKDIVELIACSEKQVMVVSEYRDKATGIVVPFKIMLDLVPDVQHPDYGKVLADLKTARNASEREFTKAVHKGAYDLQGALYSAIYVATTGEDRTDFTFVVQENTPPYQPEIWGLPEDWKVDALSEAIDALKFYCWCLAHDEWPGYHQTTRIAKWGMLSREAWMLRNIPRPPVESKAEHSKEQLNDLEVTP